jgi:hypothetical protein
MYVWRNNETRSRMIVAVDKQFYMCLCARNRARGTVYACSIAYPAFNAYTSIGTSFVAPQASPYFSTLSNKRHDFRKNVTEHKMFSFSTQILSKTFLILRTI